MELWGFLKRIFKVVLFNIKDCLNVPPPPKKKKAISQTNDNIIISIGVKQIDVKFPMIWIALNANKKISRGYTQ